MLCEDDEVIVDTMLFDADEAPVHEDTADSLDVSVLLDVLNKGVAEIISTGMKETGINTYRELQGKIQLTREGTQNKTTKGYTRSIDHTKPAPLSSFLDGATNTVWERYPIHATRLLELSDKELHALLGQRDKNKRDRRLRSYLDTCTAEKKVKNQKPENCGDNHWTSVDNAVSDIGKTWDDEFNHLHSEYKNPLHAIRNYLRGDLVTAGYCVWKHDSPYEAVSCVERPFCRGFHYRRIEEAKLVSIDEQLQDLRERKRTIMGNTFSEADLLTYGNLLEQESRRTGLDEKGQLNMEDTSDAFKTFVNTVDGSSALLGLTEPKLLLEHSAEDVNDRGDWGGFIAITIKEIRALHQIRNGHAERIRKLKRKRKEIRQRINRLYTNDQLTAAGNTKTGRKNRTDVTPENNNISKFTIDLDAPLIDENNESIYDLDGVPLTERVILGHFKDAVDRGEFKNIKNLRGNPSLFIRKPEYATFKESFLESHRQNNTAMRVQAELESEARRESDHYKQSRS